MWNVAMAQLEGRDGRVTAGSRLPSGPEVTVRQSLTIIEMAGNVGNHLHVAKEMQFGRGNLGFHSSAILVDLRLGPLIYPREGSHAICVETCTLNHGDLESPANLVILSRPTIIVPRDLDFLVGYVDKASALQVVPSLAFVIMDGAPCDLRGLD